MLRAGTQDAADQTVVGDGNCGLGATGGVKLQNNTIT